MHPFRGLQGGPRKGALAVADGGKRGDERVARRAVCAASGWSIRARNRERTPRRQFVTAEAPVGLGGCEGEEVSDRALEILDLEPAVLSSARSWATVSRSTRSGRASRHAGQLPIRLRPNVPFEAACSAARVVGKALHMLSVSQ